MYSFCFGTSEYFFEYFFLICFSDLYKETDIRYHHKSDWIKDYVTNNMLKLLRNKFNVAYIKTYTNTNTRKHTNVVPHCVPLWFNCPKNLVYSSDYHSPWDKSTLTSLFSYTWCSVYIAFETLFFFCDSYISIVCFISLSFKQNFNGNNGTSFNVRRTTFLKHEQQGTN